MNMTYLSIVVPIRNEERFIRATLESLANQDYLKDRYEIIVVDGMSTDRSKDVVKEFMEDNPDVRVLLLDNPGMLSSRARNIGIRKAKGSLIGVIDGHVYVPNDQLFKNMEMIREKYHARCLARPAPLDPPGIGDGKAYWIAMARKSWLGHSRNSLIYSNYEGFCDPVSSGFAYDREVFSEVGYFDETFDAAEDVEFHHRLKRSGIQAVTSPDLLIYSYPRETFDALFRQQARYGEGRARFICKHPDGFTMETLVPAAIFLFFCLLPFFAVLRSKFVHTADLYFSGAVLYWMVILLAGFAEALKKRCLLPGVWVASAVWTTHMGLGWGFLRHIFFSRERA